MHSHILEASDEGADYSQDPSSNEVEGSSWSIKDSLTETAEHFTNGMGIDIVKERFTRVLESAHCKQQFCDSRAWSLLIELIVLAFLWQLTTLE
jgi:hypothetical protein